MKPIHFIRRQLISRYILLTFDQSKYAKIRNKKPPPPPSAMPKALLCVSFTPGTVSLVVLEAIFEGRAGLNA